MTEEQDEIMKHLMKMQEISQEMETIKKDAKLTEMQKIALIMSKLPRDNRPNPADLILSELRLMNARLNDLILFLMTKPTSGPTPIAEKLKERMGKKD